MLIHRPRRLRQTPNIRAMVREHQLQVTDLIHPVFIDAHLSEPKAISSMPGVWRHTMDSLMVELQQAAELGIQAVLLFGIPTTKDPIASGAYAADGIVQQALQRIRQEYGQNFWLITDVCNCEYTDHGHCGLLVEQDVDNDSTLELLTQTALSHAQAGADTVAPSDMMDGRVAAIRHTLDQAGYSQTSIMAYSAKYASSFYGPFRDAADSTPQFGDRKSYQMDPANGREALREVWLDLGEGADIVMVKPGMAYMDILWRVREISDRPVAVYNVSGEYAMVKAGALQGWIDESKIVLETLTGFKRAGADLIITYHAMDAARWLKS